jgi:YHS domain-containing protein
VRRSIAIVAVIAAAVVGLLVSSCGEKQAQQQAAPAPKTQSAPQTAQSQPQAQPAAQAYTIDWCIVSGEKLGEMGPAVEYNYNGRQIKFCCKSCIKTFEKEPAKFLAKLDSAAAGLIKAPA